MNALLTFFLIVPACPSAEPQSDLTVDSVAKYEFSKPKRITGYRILLRNPPGLSWKKSETSFHRAIVIFTLPEQVEASWTIVACRLVSQSRPERPPRTAAVVLPRGKNHITKTGIAFVVDDKESLRPEERWELLLWPKTITAANFSLSKPDLLTLKAKVQIQEIQLNATRLGSVDSPIGNRFRR